MKARAAQLIVFIAFILTPVAWAEEAHYGYKVIVDAGSSGSRLHLFRYMTTSALPEISEIFTEKNKVPLASFASHPSDAGDSLKKLLTDVEAELTAQHIDPHQVSIDVLGTAGMRLLPKEQQQAIYASLNASVKNNYALVPNDFSTISGKMEGIYDWLDVNYLGHHFDDNAVTVGAIDMGGASTQLVFATEDHAKPADEVQLKINGKVYTLFAKSFLGLGQDQTRQTLNKDPRAYSCYPSGTPNIAGAHFDFTGCQMAYAGIIEQNRVAEEILPLLDRPMVAFSGVYYAYHFFGTDQQPDQANVEQQIRSVCNKSWEQLQKDYPNEAVSYLEAHCADGIYIDTLLANTYQLQGKQLQVVTMINQQSIDWTLGAMLYQLMEYGHA
jgi:apyrase